MANQGIGKMHLDLYTSNNPLTHKAKFWCNYVGALKDGGTGLRITEDPNDLLPKYKPSIWSLYRPNDICMYDLCYEDDWRTLPGSSHIFESRDPRMIMLEGDVRPTRYSLAPLTPVLPDAKDRILTPGYSYNPVHIDIYGNSGRGIAAQRKNKLI